MKRTGTIFLLTLLAGCMWQSGRQMLTDATPEMYAKSECAKWIALPPTTDQITVFGFFGFDMNYRFLKCTVGQTQPTLTDLISQSLALQPRKTNDTFILIEKATITLDGMQSVFGGVPGAVPAWWRTDLSRFDRQAFCTWQDTNNYGYGYIYLFDSKKRELRSFQWSQQWNTVAETKGKLQRGFSTSR